jgi:hypothetical protein
VCGLLTLVLVSYVLASIFHVYQAHGRVRYFAYSLVSACFHGDKVHGAWTQSSDVSTPWVNGVLFCVG